MEKRGPVLGDLEMMYLVDSGHVHPLFIHFPSTSSTFHPLFIRFPSISSTFHPFASVFHPFHPCSIHFPAMFIHFPSRNLSFPSMSIHVFKNYPLSITFHSIPPVQNPPPGHWRLRSPPRRPCFRTSDPGGARKGSCKKVGNDTI